MSKLTEEQSKRFREIENRIKHIRCSEDEDENLPALAYVSDAMELLLEKVIEQAEKIAELEQKA